ncbi:TSUP family transporter [Dysosmobacter sp.]
MELIVFAVCLAASAAGGICGIGGGIIIKPVLDAMGIMSVSAISFLSGMTVMTMAAVTVFRQGKSGLVEFRTGFPLAAGAAAGGITGNWLFQLLKAAAGQDALVGMIQAAVLALVTLLTLLYHLVLRRRFRTYHVKNPAACGLIGGLIGVLSAFLGIGGGPINLVALYAAFSMDTKKAAANSLYIILFSQAASFSLSCLRGTIPPFPCLYLPLMAAAGLGGGMLGAEINKRLSSGAADRLFLGMLGIIILICLYNLLRFV